MTQDEMNAAPGRSSDAMFGPMMQTLQNYRAGALAVTAQHGPGLFAAALQRAIDAVRLCQIVAGGWRDEDQSAIDDCACALFDLSYEEIEQALALRSTLDDSWIWIIMPRRHVVIEAEHDADLSGDQLVGSRSYVVRLVVMR